MKQASYVPDSNMQKCLRYNPSSQFTENHKEALQKWSKSSHSTKFHRFLSNSFKPERKKKKVLQLDEPERKKKKQKVLQLDDFGFFH